MIRIMDELLPPQLRAPAAVAGFRANVAVKRPLLESLFNIIPVARGKAEEQEPIIASWLDSSDEARTIMDDPQKKAAIWTAGANRALFTDAGSALMLLAMAELDRLHRRVGVSLFERGAATYAPGVSVARAIYALANQYKHLGKWRKAPHEGKDDKPIVAALVGDPMREDACAEFLKRAFATYDDFERAMLSCADDIVTDGTIPATGRGGIPVITMRSGSDTSPTSS
jgi:hypothetical protein